jgi:uncharacterized membrane protein
MTPYALPGNDYGTLLNGISDGGVLVGSYRVAGPVDPGTGLPQQVSLAFIQDGDDFWTLDVPGATQAEARGITPDGRYVSGMYSGDGDTGFFVYDRASSSFAVMRDAPGVGYAIVNGANASGTLVGTEVGVSEDYSTIERFAFRYEIASGSFSEYAGPQGDMLSPQAVSDDGVVTGWLVRDGVTLAFVDRNGAIDYLALDAATATRIQGINNDGWLVGSADIDGITVGLIAAPLAPPVPEPSTYALFAIGLGAVCWSARKRKPAARQP